MVQGAVGGRGKEWVQGFPSGSLDDVSDHSESGDSFGREGYELLSRHPEFAVCFRQLELLVWGQEIRIDYMWASPT